MSKRIAFCADGTWDNADKNTNVYKLFKALNISGEQIPLYDDGVGASGDPIIKLVGGAFGLGLWQKIKDAYIKISHVYEAGDSVYIFGFSRGAYTARSLAGMIAAVGLPTENFTNDLVAIAFDAYREQIPALRQEKLKHLANCHMDDNPDIAMVGVWDTVGSLGIPSAIGLSDPAVYGFLDTSLNPKVRNGYHALAIDERRAQFQATLWEGEPRVGQTLEQVWFTGAHSDVGGGTQSDGVGATALSDITLGWMMNKAAALGLAFDVEAFKRYTLPLDASYALDKFHESWKIICGFPVRRRIPENASMSNSVMLRCLEEESWRPRNLRFTDGILSSGYRIVDVLQEPAAAAKTAGAGNS